MAHTYDARTQEMESWEGRNFKASLGYIVQPCLYKKKGEGGKEGGRRERELVGQEEKLSL